METECSLRIRERQDAGGRASPHGHAGTSAAALLAPLCLGLGGCAGVLWGQLVVLAAAVGIFWATLQLGRPAASASMASSRSHDDRHMRR